MFVKRGYLQLSSRSVRTGLVTTLLAMAMLPSFLDCAAQAQGRSSAAAIEIPEEIFVAPAVVTKLQIRIAGAETLPRQTVLLVKGLPPRVTLSEGRSFSAGVWAVPLANVANVELAPAHGISGKADLNIQLIALDGEVLAEAKSTLYIVPQELSEQGAPGGGGGSNIMTAAPLTGRPPVTEPAQATASLGAPGLTGTELENARQLVEKGDENMEEGKIAAARLFYRSAAQSGYAPAALALGATYDASQLARSNILGGVQADPDEARKWYEKARELGSVEAERHLQNLANR